MLFQRILTGASLTFLMFTSCIQEEHASHFLPPEIVSTEAVAGMESVELRCTLSDARFDVCGFRYGIQGTGDNSVLECVPEGTYFSGTLTGLEAGQEYDFQAFVRAGEMEVRSDTRTFRLPKPSPDDPVYFEDEGFRNYMLSRCDYDLDGVITRREASSVARIEVCSDEWNIKSLKGIEYLENLEVLRCTGSWVGTSVLNRPYYYLSRHYKWEVIGPIGTLMNVDVSRNTKLKILQLSNNPGIGETGSGTVDVSKCTQLVTLDLGMCYIKYPDVSSCPELELLDLSHGWGQVPDLSNNPKLRSLNIEHHQLGQYQYVDISRNPLLEEVTINASASGLSDLSNNPNLRTLKVSWCTDIRLDLAGLAGLEWLEIRSTGTKSVDLSAMKKLRRLDIADNPLYTLDLSAQESLETLYCGGCRLSSLNISHLKNLEYLDCPWNELKELDTSCNLRLDQLYCGGNPIKQIDLSGNPYLQKFYCDNTRLTELDLSHNQSLVDLRCSDNALDHLDLSRNDLLVYLYFERCAIKDIDLSPLVELQELDCSGNGMTVLDTSHNPQLRWLVCKNNLFSSLDVSYNPKLAGPNGDEITGLFCSPMNNARGKNLLKVLWVKEGQTIDGVTVNRSTDNVPAETEIKEKNDG